MGALAPERDTAYEILTSALTTSVVLGIQPDNKASRYLQAHVCEPAMRTRMRTFYPSVGRWAFGCPGRSRGERDGVEGREERGSCGDSVVKPPCDFAKGVPGRAQQLAMRGQADTLLASLTSAAALARWNSAESVVPATTTEHLDIFPWCCVSLFVHLQLNFHETAKKRPSQTVVPALPCSRGGEGAPHHIGRRPA